VGTSLFREPFSYAHRALEQKAGYTIDADDWHADVHGRLRYAEHLSHDAELRNMLVSLPQYHAGRLFIFTNADDKHADACLTALGIRDLFPKAHVLTFETLQRCAVQRGLPPSQVLCKPQPEAFQVVLDLIGARAQRTLFLDDSTRNVAGAASIGIHAVLVGASEPCPGAIASVLDVRHLHAAVPRLWYAHATEAPAEDGDVAAALEADELEAHTTREAIEVES
jgi:pyrimidine 5'-nucleotidase